MPTNETILREDGGLFLVQIVTTPEGGGRSRLHYRVIQGPGLRPKITTDRALAESAYEAAIERTRATS